MGCPYDDDECSPGTSDFERMFTRIVLAFQAETGLEKLHVSGLAAYMQIAMRFPCVKGTLPTTKEEVVRVCKRLSRVGYLFFNENEETVTITPVGLLVCVPIRIPIEVAKAFGKKIDAKILSRA